MDILHPAVGGVLLDDVSDVAGMGVSETFGQFKLTLFLGHNNGNCCRIDQIRGGTEQEFRLDPEDLRDLAYVAAKALRALEKHE